MPRRTNDFQEVVYIVQTHLAEGSRVEESEELIDLITGAKREVDICIHSKIANHDVIVSIECSGQSRPRTVGWVDEMHIKHQRLPTNLLVLASQSGFTAEALTVAEKYGIQTVVPGAIAESFGADVSTRLDALWLKTITMSAGRVVATLEESGTLPEQRVSLFPDTQLFTRTGEPINSLGELVDHLLRDGFDPSCDAMRDATGDEKYFTMVVPAPGSKAPLEGWYVRKDDESEPVHRRILALEITGPAVVHVAEMPITHGELQGSEYAYGKAIIDTHDVLLVVTDPQWEGPRDQEKGTIRFRRLKDS